MLSARDHASREPHHKSASFAEALLDLDQRLLDALTTGENRPDVEELDYLRAGLFTVARPDLDAAAAAGLTVEPPERMQKSLLTVDGELRRTRCIARMSKRSGQVRLQ
jgi:hypothetical protein